MAQAARQNLRMQKELKLLLTDPPPGVSLSDDSSSSSSSFSLSNIDAKIKGPDGTVYANGVFKIKIQIPDRYPFQPPNVTFATPIYHPNIDNGGRICLDILNLPPKGAWQPSLNISTVLMSIGLLLSEPNPDDGLMCEASREYKYNKQTFDQKARSMTEKYARSNASVETTHATTKPSSPVSMEEEGQNQEPRLSRVSRKLSLESSLVPSQKKHEVNIAHTGSLSTNSASVSAMPDVGIHNGQPHCASKEGDANLSASLTESSDAPQIMANNENAASKSKKKRLGIGRKLSLQPDRSVSLKSPLLPLSDNCDTKQPPHQALLEETEDCGMRKKHEVSIAQSGSLSTNSAAVSDMPDVRIHNGEPPCAGKEGNASLSASPQKRPLVESPNPRPVLANKENVASKSENKRLGIGRKLSLQPERSVSLKSPLLPLSVNCDKNQQSHQALTGKTDDIMPRKKMSISRKLSLGISTSKSKWEDDDDGNKENINPNYQLKSASPIFANETAKEEEVIMSDAVIVLDSEDSDEEEVKVSRRSRLSIARKPLAGKRKAKT